MAFLPTLKRKPPEGKRITLTKFVPEHFDEITEARRLGYSWREIWEAIQATNKHFVARNENALASVWSKENSRRKKLIGGYHELQ